MRKWKPGATYEYAETYTGGDFGNSTINVVAPLPISKEEIKRILQEYQQAGWDIWDSLSIEEQIQINKEATAELGK